MVKAVAGTTRLVDFRRLVVRRRPADLVGQGRASRDMTDHAFLCRLGLPMAARWG